MLVVVPKPLTVLPVSVLMAPGRSSNKTVVLQLTPKRGSQPGALFCILSQRFSLVAPEAKNAYRLYPMSPSSFLRDPYTVLGLTRSASAADIKRAYRSLAMQYHPDRNPGNATAEQKLKEINAAYTFISNEEKRKRYDNGEIDANGQETGYGFGTGFGSGPGAAHGSSYRYGSAGSTRRGHGARNFFDEDDFMSEDILNEIFGTSRRARQKSSSQKNTSHSAKTNSEPSTSRDINYTLSVPFIEATRGGKRTIQLGSGKDIALTIPPGTDSGTKLRLKGKGQAARFGQSSGDALILIKVEPHDFFTRDGMDIRCEIPVSLSEAVLGAKIRVPTIDGMVDMRIPEGANTGTTLRLKGKGVPHADGSAGGDQYVRLRIMLPRENNDELADFLKKWKAGLEYNPRKLEGIEP